MHFTILFLLIIGLSIANGVRVQQIKGELVQFLLKHGSGNPIDSNDHHLQLLSDRLGFTAQALVWKGVFDGRHDVSVKISTNQSYADQEIAGYRAANAMDDPDIESKGIPKIYYTGRIFGKYSVIVMTLFDETLFDRWEKQNDSFNAFSTLEVFLQLAKTLKYLKSRNVLHNDIKPGNIFLRGNEVFLGDFDIATSNGEMVEFGTDTFGSSSYWTNLGKPGGGIRHFMDDLESLVYTIWYIEDINDNVPSGLTISSNTNNKKFVLEKCEHFKNFPRSLKALKFICKDEMLSGRKSPDYKRIVKRLTEAIDEVKKRTGQTSFEWLPCASSASSSTSSSSSLLFGYPGENKPKGH